MQTRNTDLHTDVPVDSRGKCWKNKASKEQIHVNTAIMKKITVQTRNTDLQTGVPVDSRR